MALAGRLAHTDGFRNTLGAKIMGRKLHLGAQRLGALFDRQFQFLFRLLGPTEYTGDQSLEDANVHIIRIRLAQVRQLGR